MFMGKNKGRDRKYLFKFCLIFFVVLIIFIIFCIINYNFSKSGNNNHKKIENRTINEIVNSVQNYYAETKVEITSNKTVNTYIAKESCIDENSKFETLDGKLLIENKDNKIIIYNGNNINTKEYKIENKLNNNLFLIVAIKEIEELCSINENNVKVEKVKEKENKNKNRREFENNNVEKISYINTYGAKKELYYDVEKKTFEKMKIRYDVQNIDICIRYKYIEFK